MRRATIDAFARYTYYWNASTGESTWEAPLRRAISKLAVLRSLGAGKKPVEMTAEQVIAEHQRRHRAAIVDEEEADAKADGSDNGKAIPCPADFDPEEWAKMPRELQLDMADGAEAAAEPELKSAAGRRTKAKVAKATAAAEAAEAAAASESKVTSAEMVATIVATTTTQAEGTSRAGSGQSASADSAPVAALGVIDGDGKWQNVSTYMQQNANTHNLAARALAREHE